MTSGWSGFAAMYFFSYSAAFALSPFARYASMSMPIRGGLSASSASDFSPIATTPSQSFLLSAIFAARS